MPLSDQSYGLRFDIYERVHLSSEEVGIDELEEIELFPRIQVIPGDEYAMLRGHLLLTGLYRGEDETRELSHLIPVEITVPLSRVNRLEDISVEIENFDVDLLNERSLNVTGVLSLQGIETAAFAPAPQEWNSREYTASYEPGIEAVPWISADAQFEPKAEFNEAPGQLGSNGSFSPETGFAAQVNNQERLGQDSSWAEDTLIYETKQEQNQPQNQPQQENAILPNFNFQALAQPEPDFWQRENEEGVGGEPDFSAFIPAVRPEADGAQEVFLHSAEEPAGNVASAAEAEENEGLEEPEAQPVSEEHVEPVKENLAPENEAPENEAPAKEEEKSKELKVALGSQKKNQVQKEHFGFSQLLNSIKPKSSDDSNRPDYEAEFDEELYGEPEDRHWKQAFISNLTESPFRTVRMVIVQREETIDDIALRYSINARELLLHNRLSEQNITEGQVLYLP